jgi:drug/metabolite transporter (DMT)-like permease
MWALQFVSAGLERILLMTMPFFIAAYHLFRGDKLSSQQLIGMLVTYSGIFIFYWQEQAFETTSILLPVILLFIATGITAGFNLSSQHLGQKYSSQFFTAVAMGMSISTIVPHALTNITWSQLTWSSEIWAGLTFLALGCTVLASLFINKGVSMVGAFSASLMASLGPIVTIVASILFLDEKVSYSQWLAVIVVTLGVYIGQNRSKSPP